MRKGGLTDTAIRNAKAAGSRRVQLSDFPVTGLILEVTPNEHKSFIARPRVGGQQERITFQPPYPELRLAVGRERWWKVEAARKCGADLATLRIIAAGNDPAAPSPARSPADTVERVAEKFRDRYLIARKRDAAYVAATMANLRNHVFPAWKDRAITSITRRDVIARIDAVAESAGPTAANRTLATLSKLFRWAQQRDLIDTLPVVNIAKAGEETSRDRVLTDAELSAVLRASHQLGLPFGPYIRVLAMTGQRRAEVAAMRWADLDVGVWTLPAESAKNARVHLVPLATPVVELLRTLPKHGPYVFSSDGESPVSGFSKAKTRLDKLTGEAVEPWVLHDLRRSCATGLSRLGVPRIVIEKVLNHTDRSVTGIYDRHEFLAEKRDALERWADKVAGLTRPQIVEPAHA
jgi:integrase